MTKVLYVMGTGRSGSTLLGVALDNCDGFFYAGELDAWLRRRGVPNDARDQTRTFWESVAAEVGDVSDPEVAGDACWTTFEHSTAALRPRRRWRARKLRRGYRDITSRLFAAISEVSGEPVVVDSSHYPLRARELRAMPGLQVYLVFLVRDPQGVVDSFRSRRTQGGKGLIAANAYIWLTNLLGLSIYLTQRRSRRLLMRYEDLLEDPQSALQRIASMVGESSCPRDLLELRVGCAFQGNRLLQGSTVVPDRSRAAVADRSRLTALVQLPWSLAFSALAAGRR